MRRHLPERLRGIRAGKTWVCGDESFYFGLEGNFFAGKTSALYQYGFFVRRAYHHPCVNPFCLSLF